MNFIQLRRAGLVIAASALAAACADSVGPEGAPTDLTVRAYVDADGSGTFTAGDLPISGATVTATTPDGTAAAQAQTDASGVATFPGLRPGTYALALQATPPAGAVLASAANPLVTADALGGTEAAEFRFAFLPGSISGVLYRDEDASGAFEAGIDLPAPGVTVQLFRGTPSGDPVAETTTGADGSFAFGTVRPGTYTVRFLAPDGITLVDGADQTVVVTATGDVSLQAEFTGNLVVPIAEARARPLDASVTVEGVVTVAQGTFRTDNAYVQDASGGIQVFGLATDLGLELGDSIRVSGNLGQFNNEEQIVDPVVTVLGTGTVPAPRTVSGAEMAGGGFEGELARISGVVVQSVGGQSSDFSSFNVVGEAPDGTTVTIRVEGRTNVENTAFVVGEEYDVAGVLSVFRDTPQIKPRGLADVAPSNVATIAEVRAVADSTPVVTQGVVTVGQGTFRTDNAYIQDATGGILLFGLPSDLGLQVGDSVRVTGTRGSFFGELQIVNPGLAVTRLGTATPPAPRTVTGAELLGRTYEGQLGRIVGAEVLTVGSQSSATSSFNVTARAPDGTTFTIRVEGRTDVENTAFTVGGVYDVVGALSVFGGNGQIKPRSLADVTAR